MNAAQLAHFLRLNGRRVEETPGGLWEAVGYGFVRRLPVYELRPPSVDEVRLLFKRSALVGLYYTLGPEAHGKPGGVYFVRDPDYGIQHLAEKERRKTRRGIENCQIRRMSFPELRRLGLALNQETLGRQGRSDLMFGDAECWSRFCEAGAQVEGVEAWGAFVADQLATYTILFRVGDVVNILYTMSSTTFMKYHSSPALTFTVTQTMMRTPGVLAVCFGPEGLSSTAGLDEYKQRMGYVKEAVAFAVRLRPVVRRALLSWPSRHVIGALGYWWSRSEVYRRVQSIVDIASASRSVA